MILSPEIAFTGDTTAEYMLDPRNADALRAKVLITEVLAYLKILLTNLASELLIYLAGYLLG